MKKHPILLFALAFILGLIIGGVAIGSFFVKYESQTMEIVMLKHRAGLEEKAFQAYLDESSEVAIWALENLVSVLKEQLKVSPEKDQLIQKDIVLTNARLAILYKRMGNTNKYNRNISEALKFSQVAYKNDISNKNELLEFVAKLDAIAKNRKHQ